MKKNIVTYTVTAVISKLLCVWQPSQQTLEINMYLQAIGIYLKLLFSFWGIHMKIKQKTVYKLAFLLINQQGNAMNQKHHLECSYTQ